jgi:glutaredoxin
MSVIHIKKFQSSNRHGDTPNEAFRRGTFGHNRCTECGGPPAIQIRVFMPVDEMQRRSPNVLAALMADCMSCGEDLPTIALKSSPVADPKPHLCVSNVFACDQCKATAEKAAAHGPSFAIIEISRGPDPTNRVVVA